MPNIAFWCPYYLKDHMKAMLYWQISGFIFQIWAQWIDSKTIDEAFISYICSVILL